MKIIEVANYVNMPGTVAKNGHFAAATAAGMSHQARKASAAIRKGENHDAD